MINQKEHPTPEQIAERVRRAYKSPNMTFEEKKDLAMLFGMAMMMAAACKQMLDDYGIE